ncbi:hypothetical protein [Oscillatoria sp. FACHB-1407]|nr:hypothetical protein [Oscillatoria sp. FACHB-1407]
MWQKDQPPFGRSRLVDGQGVGVVVKGQWLVVNGQGARGWE